MFFQEGVTDVMFAVQEITTRLGDEEVITVNVNKFSWIAVRVGKKYSS